MFNFFKKKSATSELESQHKKVMEEAYRLSKVNRTESDAKYAEADRIMSEIVRLKEAVK